MNLLKTPMRRVTALVAGSLLGLAGAAAFAAPASAHEPDLQGSPTCLQDGGWKVDWTVGNPYNLSASIEAVSVDGKPATKIEDIFGNRTVDARSTVTGSTTQKAGVDTVTLSVTLHWSDGWTSPPKMKTVYRPRGCKPHSPSPSPHPSTSSPTPSPSVSTSPTPGQSSPAPGPSPSLPIPSGPAAPTPILKMDCTSMTIGLDNPAKGTEFRLHFKPSTGSETDLDIKPGEKKTTTFAAGKGFKVTVTVSTTVDGKQQSTTETVNYVQPGDCGDGGLAKTGSAAGPLAGGAAAILAIGGVLFYLARRRRVKFTA